MKEEISKILSELIEEEVDIDFKEDYKRNGIKVDLLVKILLCKQLDRIANSLENIDCNICGLEDSLNALNALSECVTYIPPMYHQKEGYYVFRIAGQIDTN